MSDVAQTLRWTEYAVKVNQPAASPLQRQLRGQVRPTALDAFDRAKRRFLAGDRVDMQSLASELGVNRVTLYRWVGSREQLLAEVLWVLTERSIRGYLAEADNEPHVGELLSRFVRDVLANPGIQRLLDDEGAFAMSLLTSRDGGYEPRLIALVRELLVAQAEAGHLASDIPVEDLAYTAVRITESYIHSRVITGEDPDADRAARVLRTLLR